MKDYLKKIIASKEARAKELREAIKASADVNEVRALGDTLQAVLDELNDAKAQLDAIEADEAKSADEGRSAVTVARGINPLAAMGFDVSEKREDNSQKEAEARAQKFADTSRMTIENTEARAVLVAGGKIATPTEVAGINDAFNKVSSIVDQVNVEDASNMGELKVAYVVDEADASVITEGQTITEGDVTFAFTSIKPSQVAILTYISNQVVKQSPLMYEAKVKKAALDALRAKAAETIVTKIVQSSLKKFLLVEAIDEKTLRKVALNYGGNENVEQGATLYLNKNTLVAFGDVRGTDKKPVYKITPSTSNPNTGIIEDGGLAVPYTIVSKLADTQLVYGQAKNATLALFGDYEIKVSEDFAFDKNMLAIRGTVDMGAGVCFKDGFIVTGTEAEPGVGV